MKASPLAGVDLNLLTVFRAIDESRHVTQAAHTLGLSQPALSHALRRLRETFGDPLFVRTPKGMAPTPLAEALSEPIRASLAAIERNVFDRGAFDPKTFARTFRIRTTDFVEGLFAAPLLAALEGAAPLVRFASSALGFALPKDELEEGTCDLAIAGFFGDLGPSFHHAPLFEDSFACAVRKDHPRISSRTKLSIDLFCEERHVLVAPSGELTGAVDRALASRKRSRRVVAGTSGFLGAGFLTVDSDCILTAPRRVLTMLAKRLPLRLLDAPLSLPTVKVVSVWHERNASDPGHTWFRELVRKTVA